MHRSKRRHPAKERMQDLFHQEVREYLHLYCRLPPEGPVSPELGGRLTVVLKVMSDSFYQVLAEGMINGKPMKEYLDARRVGDCEK